MKCHILFNPFTLLYHSTLLGGEFDNCHGQGGTVEESIISLKIRRHQLRDKKT